jgi:hypothetical protein
LLSDLDGGPQSFAGVGGRHLDVHDRDVA